MTTKGPTGAKPAGQKVPKEWADTALAPALAKGFTLPAIAKLAGINYLRVYRLSVGEGSVKTARQVREALAKIGEKPPPLVMTDIDDADEEWSALGAELREVAPAEYEKQLAKIRRYLELKKEIASGIDAIGEPLPYTPDPDDG